MWWRKTGLAHFDNIFETLNKHLQIFETILVMIFDQNYLSGNSLYAKVTHTHSHIGHTQTNTHTDTQTFLHT